MLSRGLLEKASTTCHYCHYMFQSLPNVELSYKSLWILGHSLSLPQEKEANLLLFQLIHGRNWDMLTLLSSARTQNCPFLLINVSQKNFLFFHWEVSGCECCDHDQTAFAYRWLASTLQTQDVAVPRTMALWFGNVICLLCYVGTQPVTEILCMWTTSH